ncbi:tetratricopeptide (TPR) repeat protein [Dysgonomonas sp. PFB1-18]|uniref:tetratricopeptide repeat protein n=1 Tax=unclassified Dysgonomonas TaxID=2630389 RepID=UPI0024769B67|nr:MULTISPECIES: tetratricopeptide repeat protein [unclassified Dysgonomonas]MDH6311094.1 tetratricopeptide (TPR) repeat protein [Dysgonomonas sp. PF1-14]MDH6340953.1 tetratricopeptide (TPR) repeat protein [Dysgonomonas sp. PF1-16]MDH6382600.1 tetratricopeptide (TPR) repeat protein [Dysgonomonas sp. PFB1-18]MDH6399959.1 tetratricopeptide (TPR) repeat protein [Dysgonomonas sp. PF1-23]
MKYICFWSLILSAFLFSCSSDSQKAENYLAQAQNLLEINPDSTLSLLDSILLPDNLGKKKYNRYLLLRIQAKDKAYKDIAEDTIIFQIKDYYIQKKNPQLSTLASYYCGRVLESQKKNKEAMTEYVNAEKYAEKTTDYNTIGLIQSSIGYLYYDQFLYDEALPRFKAALRYYEQANGYKNEVLSYKDIGNCFLIRGKGDSAFHYYEKGLEIANHFKDTTVQVDIRQNIALIQKQRGNYKKAKDGYFQIIKYVNSSDSRAKNYSNIAQIYQKENKVDSAIIYFEKALTEASKTESYTLNARIYRFLSQIHKEKRDYKQAMEYNILYNKNRDKIFAADERQIILDIQKKYNYELIKNENNLLKVKEQNMFILSIALGLIILIIILIFYYIKQQKEKDILEAHEKINELDNMAKSYDEEKSSFRNKLLHHFDILKKSALLEGYMRDEEKEQNQKLLKRFNEIVYNQTTLDWNILYQTMNDLHNGFFDSLRKTFPQLDESEFRICCLIYTEFSNIEIGIIMRQSSNTITAKRTVIRKKIGMKGHGNFIDFFNESVINK